MTFNDLPSALHWCIELLSCPVRGINYDPDRLFGAMTSAGDGYHRALDIKISADRCARRIGAEDDRGNWILLTFLPLDQPIAWREWEKRKIARAVEELTDTLINKGYLRR